MLKSATTRVKTTPQRLHGIISTSPARWSVCNLSTPASCVFLAWVEKGMGSLKLMISYWSFFADPQFKEDISGRLCHHYITKFCRPPNSKLKMGDQDPLHIARDGQEDSQTEFEIPHWLSFVVLTFTSSSFFFSLVSNSNSYLTSNTGYAHGGDMYSHQVEALYLKELLQSGTTDLWFDELTLGYPFFLAYHPLPCLLNVSLMILGES